MPTLIKELFVKNPLDWRILNDGVSSNNPGDLATLRYELETFVCDGEYRSGMERILRGYLDCFGQEQKAAWVSGFYGSGKSHLVKVLRYLWTDFQFPDGQHARNIGVLPEEIQHLLKELSTRGKQGAGLHSAGGTLKAGVGSVRLRLLAIILQSAGLAGKLSVARLQMDLRDEGKLDAVRKAITAAGKDPDEEFDKLYTSKALQQAYLDAFPHLESAKNVSEAMRAQYPTKVEDVSIEDTVKLVRRALAKNGKLPCTLVVLDEIQQFINNNADTALEVQEVVEACSKMLDGLVLFIGTGQSALSDTPALQRLLGRFTVRVHLKDNDVEKVVRTVVLRKKEDRKGEIRKETDRQSGEIERQLKGTKIAARSDDSQAYVPDYPLLPVRLRFWEHVLHNVDATGTQAQMRTQLRVAHEACQAVANRPVGAVVPGDFLYGQLANILVVSGGMQRRFQEIIESQKTKPEGELRSRICALVFLISKLPDEGSGDVGVRATPEHLADLLTDDLGPSASALREKIPGLVKALVDESVLMAIDDEYRLQTTEGAAWETEYKRARAAAINNDPQIAAQRGQLLTKAVEEELAGVSVLHGQPRVKRKVSIHHGLEGPTGDGIIVWVRDGFQESQTVILQDIQRRSVDDATIHVLIPKVKADEIKQAMASVEAAKSTLYAKGNPTSNEGREAKAAMVTRQTKEETRLDAIVGEVMSDVKVFLSGGQELPGVTPRAAVELAADQVLGRLYPRFAAVDSPNWPAVWNRAKEGNAAALSVVGHQGDPDQHPVCVQLLSFIAAGRKGSEIEAQFSGVPYGWPDDAIHGCLAALVVSGHLSVRLQGQPTRLTELDHRKMRLADFRVERPVLTAQQKLRLRKLFQGAGHPFQPGDEASAATGYVQLLKQLARKAGGDAPLPMPPSPPDLIDLENLSGNDLLFALFEKADDLDNRVLAWKNTADEIARRLPNYQTAMRLAMHGRNLADVNVHGAELDEVQKNRSLLDEPDPVAAILTPVAAVLRAALQKAHEDYERLRLSEQTKLDGHDLWQKLPQPKRDELLRVAGVAALARPAVSTPQDLLASLDATDLGALATQADALPTRFAAALSAAIREAEPKAKHLSLPPATIRVKEDIDPWLKRARAEIEAALKDGPVIL